MNLFGGHVRGRAHYATRTGEFIFHGHCRLRHRGWRLCVVGLKLRESEIENFGVLAGGDENIGGLDVAMDDACLVRGVQSVGDFDGQRQQLPDRHRLATDAFFQGLPLEEFHRDVGLAVLFADVVDGADVGMIQGRGSAGLATEPA